MISHSLKLPVQNVSTRFRRLRYPARISENSFLRHGLQELESERGCQTAQLESATGALQDIKEG